MVAGEGWAKKGPPEGGAPARIFGNWVVWKMGLGPSAEGVGGSSLGN